MRRTIELVVFAMLTAAILPAAQADEWVRLMYQAHTLERAGDYTQAVASYREAIGVAERLGAQDRRLVITLNRLGSLYQQLGQSSEAKRQYRRALSLVEQSSGRESRDYAVLLANVASILVEDNQVRTGETMLRHAIDLYRNVLSPDDVRVAAARNTLAELLIAKRRYDEAAQSLNEALSIMQKRPEPRTGHLALVLDNLGVVRRCQHNQGQAMQLFEKSVALIESELGSDHPLLVRPLCNLATSYAESGRPEDADLRFRRALDIAEKRFGRENSTYGNVLHSYATFLRKTGHTSQAKVLETRSKQVLSQAARRNGTGQTVDAEAFVNK